MHEDGYPNENGDIHGQTTVTAAKRGGIKGGAMINVKNEKRGCGEEK